MTCMPLNTTQELIEDIAAGKMVIIMDDEDRENEGDFIIAAQHCAAEHVNFMAKHGRGLICLTLTEERCQQLNLPLMVSNTGGLHSTNFTLSIEAAEGVTTGISAADRARTIEAAIKDQASPSDICQPGHVFPLMAQEGGVLTRAGHTEAGCDFARAANLEPAAVIVEILNDDGTMARRPDLEKIAKKFDLKIGTIADLIRFRAENEKTITRVASTVVDTQSGPFQLVAYEDALHEGLHIALIKGQVNPEIPPLVRVQSHSPFDELNAVIKSDPTRQLNNILTRFDNEQSGVLVILANQLKNEDIISAINKYSDTFRTESLGKSDSHQMDWRRIGLGAQILSDIGVRKMRVLGHAHKYHAISGFGLEVIGHVGLS